MSSPLLTWRSLDQGELPFQRVFDRSRLLGVIPGELHVVTSFVLGLLHIDVKVVWNCLQPISIHLVV